MKVTQAHGEGGGPVTKTGRPNASEAGRGPRFRDIH